MKIVKHLYPNLISHGVNLALGFEYSLAILVYKDQEGKTQTHFYKVHINETNARV